VIGEVGEPERGAFDEVVGGFGGGEPAAGTAKQPLCGRSGGAAWDSVQKLAPSDGDDAGGPDLGPEPAAAPVGGYAPAEARPPRRRCRAPRHRPVPPAARTCAQGRLPQGSSSCSAACQRRIPEDPSRPAADPYHLHSDLKREAPVCVGCLSGGHCDLNEHGRGRVVEILWTVGQPQCARGGT